MSIDTLQPPGTVGEDFKSNVWQAWFRNVRTAINALIAQANANPVLLSYTVANLPAGSSGALAYATNGRKVGEGAGAGTGVPVYYSTSHWRVFSTDAVVAS
jgi:hypothetical protein